MVNETEIVSRYRSGVSVPVLIREYGGDLVYTVLTREVGVIPNPGPNFLPYRSPDHYSRMKGMVAEGCSHSEIKRTIGSDARTIKRWFPGSQWDSYGSGKANDVRMMKRKLEEVGRDRV